MADVREVWVGKPLTDHETTVGIRIILTWVAFIGTWAIFGGTMTRMAEVDDYYAQTRQLEARLETMTTQVVSLEHEIASLRKQRQPGPMETGGALALTTLLAAEPRRR